MIKSLYNHKYIKIYTEFAAVLIKGIAEESKEERIEPNPP